MDVTVAVIDVDVVAASVVFGVFVYTAATTIFEVTVSVGLCLITNVLGLVGVVGAIGGAPAVIVFTVTATILNVASVLRSVR